MRYRLIKRLQTAFPHGGPFDRRGLTKLGVSSSLANHYSKSGWLERLGRGVFMFPKDNLHRDDCLKFLAHRVTGLHVGGKTALAWRGVRHNLSAHEPLSLWGGSASQFAGLVSETFSRTIHGPQPVFFQVAEELWFATVARNTARGAGLGAGTGAAGVVV